MEMWGVRWAGGGGAGGNKTKLDNLDIHHQHMSVTL